RFLFLASGFVHRLFWIPAALIPLFIIPNQHHAVIWSVTILITVSSVAYSVNMVAFNSWMGDLVPEEIAGRFFGIRNLVGNITGGIAALALGVYLDRVNNFNGFAIVFLVGVLFGALEVVAYFFIDHPPMALDEEKPSLLYILTEPLKNGNYRKFVLFATLFAFSVNISMPFFNVYMIENLKMSYLSIGLADNIAFSIGAVIMVHRWGVLSDRFGNKPVVMVNGLMIASIPILWLFVNPSNSFAIVFLSNFVSGIVWSGYNLTIFNQSVWLAPEKNRSAYIASYTLFTSVIGTALANVCGGYFMQTFGSWINLLRLPFIAGETLNSYQVLFVCSGILRILSVLLFLPMVYEKNSASAKTMIRETTGSLRNITIRKKRSKNDAKK
ncbi:MAG TPA: MFS transporter, partial [Clostridia bacterium]|nr:MFS transporter [Clostridia bacterium]